MSYAIEVQNKFVKARRDVHAYRKYSDNGNIVTLQEETIGFPPNENEVRKELFNLGAQYGDQEFLEIVVDNDQLDLGPTTIDFPVGRTIVISPGLIKVTATNNGLDVRALSIRTGKPQWRVEIAMPVEGFGVSSPDNVSIGDDNGGGGPG
ncbi:MAG: hypothetical protein JSV88_05240 [Candidatus Aminicenantes bacterium]|nr:MAG: hypothetical protein JSV88_05240 [Candidatus Aminicenantes bacterium]